MALETLLHMPPPMAPFDIGNGAWIKTDCTRNIGLASFVSAYLSNYFRVNFGVGILRSAIGAALSYGIGHISRSRVPPQVFNSVVRAISILVAAIYFAWHFFVKSGQNKAVHRMFFRNAIGAKSDQQIPEGGQIWLQRADQPFVLLDSADVSKRGRFIQALIPADWLPNFFHNQSPLIDFRGLVCGSRHGYRFSRATLATQGRF